MVTLGAFLKDKYKKDYIGKKEVTMSTCHICSKKFRRGDNRRRHVIKVHADFKDDKTIDDRDNPESIEEDDATGQGPIIVIFI